MLPFARRVRINGGGAQRFLTARWFPKLYHSLTTSRHGRASPVYRRCALWLPTFLKRGIHFLGERTKVLGLNNSVFLDRFHLPIIGNRAGIVNSHNRML